jgi:hypothetical protein
MSREAKKATMLMENMAMNTPRRVKTSMLSLACVKEIKQKKQMKARKSRAYERLRKVRMIYPRNVILAGRRGIAAKHCEFCS